MDCGKAIIVCNGSIKDYSFYKRYFEDAKYIICADGGAYHLKKFGIKPDILVGDLDSISSDDFEYFKNLGVEVFKYPAEKDMTDTELAVEYAIEKGCKEILFIGSTGSRLDHSLANVLMLRRLLDKDVHGIIVNENNEITVTNDKVTLKREKDTRVTLLALTEKAEGVSTKGLYYPLHNAALEMGSSWGVSNEFAEETAEVTVKKGILLVIKARD